jgi:DNA-directed RNA polymerase subunit RPC12/RpoP
MPVTRSSLIAKTRQGWKVMIGDVLAVVVVIDAVTLFSLATLFAGVAIIAIETSIRCPRCCVSLGWRALRDVPITRSYRELTQREDCPACGYRGPE